MKKRIIACMLSVIAVMLTSCTGMEVSDNPKDSSVNTVSMIADEQSRTDESLSEPATTEAKQSEDTETLLVSTEEITTEPVTSSEPIFQMPDQSYVGRWSDSIQDLNDIYIYEITPEYVKFEISFYRLFGVKAIATEENGELVFVDRDDSDITGKLKFEEDGITVIFDSYGARSEYRPATNKKIHKFTYKDPRSDEIIKNAKEHMYW